MDLAVYAIITAIGILGFFLYRHSDFYFDDVAALGRAQSLLRHRLYGYEGSAELVQPPGLATIFAVVVLSIGSTYATLLRTIVVFWTLSSLATYELLRREEGRKVAASVCLLLASSPICFSMATTALHASYPYMLAAALVLIAARKADAAPGGRSRVLWATMTALLTVAAIMVESRGVALLGALTCWMAVSYAMDRSRAVERLKTFLPALILGIAVEGWWMSRAPSSSDWPLPGYPASYVSQLLLKRGDFPELGMASPVDVVVRMEGNLHAGAAALSELLGHHWINPSWASLAILGIALLVFLGIGSSLCRPGHRLMDWYFLGTAGIFLLWPWPFEPRFFLPGAAFAAVYAWRGINEVRRMSTRRPRPAGAVGLVVSVPLAAYASFWALGLRTGGGLGGGLQSVLSALAWSTLAVGSAWMLWKGFVPRFPWKALAKPGAILLAVLVVAGVSQEIQVGWHNTHLSDLDLRRPDVEGAKWINTHTAANAVVLASHNYIVNYYARRRTYWFPPISRPEVLLDGIRQRSVNYVLVVTREDPYYLPSDRDCFDRLLEAHPEAFRLAESGRDFSVYEVLSGGRSTRERSPTLIGALRR